MNDMSELNNPRCPYCGCQLKDPFTGTVIIHDTAKCALKLETAYKNDFEFDKQLNKELK